MTRFSAAAPLLAALLLCPAIVSATPSLIVDGDGDGVSDERDECPYSEAGARVDDDGCSHDDDGDSDGVLDVADRCPYSTPGARVDDEGCSLDDDFDGIANGRDACPDTAIGERVDARGCEPGAPARGRTQLAAVGAAAKSSARAPTPAVPVPVALRAAPAATPIAVPIAVPVPVQVPVAKPIAAVTAGRIDTQVAIAETPSVAVVSGAAAVPAAGAVAGRRQLPPAPQIVLTPNDVLAVQRHPTASRGVVAPPPAVRNASAAPPPRAVPSAVALPLPAVRRRPPVPTVVLSPDAARTIDAQSEAEGANAVRVPRS